MKVFKADLHIHTILSPCASLDMSPRNIVNTALEQHLDIIGITDHNSTLQCEVVITEANKQGLIVYPGVEITTKEEIHCLAYFETLEQLKLLQTVIDDNLPDIKNNTNLFGYQVVVDEHENIVFEEDRLLISALTLGIDQVENIVHELGGVFIPAHVNKLKDSLISQLGFIPPTLNVDAFELTKHIGTKHFRMQNRVNEGTSVIRNSDAHMLSQIGDNSSFYTMETTAFSEFRMALHNESGRKVVNQ